MAEHATPVMTRRPKALLKIERRAWLRLPNEQDIVCHPVTSGPQIEPELAWMGKVQDISPAGIGLSMNRRFEPGTELVAELSVKSDASLLLPVHMVHATPPRGRRCQRRAGASRAKAPGKGADKGSCACVALCLAPVPGRSEPVPLPAPLRDVQSL